MVAEVVPRPTIEATLAHMRHVVRDKVVAERVALVRRAPELAGCRVNAKTDGIANAGRVDAYKRAIGCVLKNIGATGFSGMSIRIETRRAKILEYTPDGTFVRV